MKRTFQPKKRHRATKHGFLARSKSSNGRKVLAARRAKGRAKLAAREGGAQQRSGRRFCRPAQMRLRPGRDAEKRKRRALRRRREARPLAGGLFAYTMK